MNRNYYSKTNGILFNLQVFNITGKYVELNPAFRDYRERTGCVAEVLQNLRKENEICALKGWRDEVFFYVSLLASYEYFWCEL